MKSSNNLIVMGKRLFVLFLIAISTTLNAQTGKSKEEASVEQVITGFFDGIATLDPKKIMQFITKDFLLLEDGAIWNIDTLITKLKPLKSVSFSRTNHLNFIQTTVRGNTAWVAYKNAAAMVINGLNRNVKWIESAVLVKEGYDWKLQMLHSTPLKPATN